jgi:hypothetical protein
VRATVEQLVDVHVFLSHFCIYYQVDERNTLGKNLKEVPASPDCVRVFQV